MDSLDDEGEGDVQIHHDDDEQQDDRSEKSEEVYAFILDGMGPSYSFCAKARAVVKQMPTPGCPGYNFATGRVNTNTECGHSPACKARMMKLMAEDLDERHRVKTWFMEEMHGEQERQSLRG